MYRDDLSRPAFAKVIMENVSPSPLVNGLVRCVCRGLVAPISNSSAFQSFFAFISMCHFIFTRLIVVDFVAQYYHKNKNGLKRN